MHFNVKRCVGSLALLAVLCGSAFGASGAKSRAPSGERNTLETSSNVFELGLSLGIPSGVGLQLGWWNLGGSPMLLRINAGTLGLLLEADANVGYLFDNNGSYKQFFAAVGGYLAVVELGSSSNLKGWFVGPGYGFVVNERWTFLFAPIYFPRESKVFGLLKASWSFF